MSGSGADLGGPPHPGGQGLVDPADSGGLFRLEWDGWKTPREIGSLQGVRKQEVNRILGRSETGLYRAGVYRADSGDGIDGKRPSYAFSRGGLLPRPPRDSRVADSWQELLEEEPGAREWPRLRPRSGEGPRDPAPRRGKPRDSSPIAFSGEPLDWRAPARSLGGRETFSGEPSDWGAPARSLEGCETGEERLIVVKPRESPVGPLRDGRPGTGGHREVSETSETQSDAFFRTVGDPGLRVRGLLSEGELREDPIRPSGDRIGPCRRFVGWARKILRRKGDETRVWLSLGSRPPRDREDPSGSRSRPDARRETGKVFLRPRAESEVPPPRRRE